MLGALARNVVTNGYQASHSNDALEQTEYLKLVHRYLSQARELEKLAGAEKVLKVENCESATAGDLLKILGYRMRGGALSVWRSLMQRGHLRLKGDFQPIETALSCCGQRDQC